MEISQMEKIVKLSRKFFWITSRKIVPSKKNNTFVIQSNEILKITIADNIENTVAENIKDDITEPVKQKIAPKKSIAKASLKKKRISA
ncbi:MAG: hypothetical protein Ta2E_11260 [Mycoplasmoidaceae bacterium]|nr:MAG: hypothetical protein Ta2E_11260 [Mycoplasmoidaceae bacterium]